jgi:hypothetical protein
MAFVDKLRSWPAAFRALGGVTSGASSESNETWSNRTAHGMARGICLARLGWEVLHLGERLQDDLEKTRGNQFGKWIRNDGFPTSNC